MIAAARRIAAAPRGAGDGDPRAARREAGFSLLEVMFATAVLAVTLVGLVGVTTLSIRRSAHAADTARAVGAARALAETLGATPIEEVFARFNATTADDPPGASPGPTFAVAGLAPLPLATSVGRIVFPTGGSGHLSEVATSGTAPELRHLQDAPRDLNGDGDSGDTDVDASYRLLPVKVVIDWRGAYDDQHYELCLLLVDRSQP